MTADKSVDAACILSATYRYSLDFIIPTHLYKQKIELSKKAL